MTSVDVRKRMAALCLLTSWVVGSRKEYGYPINVTNYVCAGSKDKKLFFGAHDIIWQMKRRAAEFESWKSAGSSNSLQCCEAFNQSE